MFFDTSPLPARLPAQSCLWESKSIGPAFPMTRCMTSTKHHYEKSAPRGSTHPAAAKRQAQPQPKRAGRRHAQPTPTSPRAHREGSADIGHAWLTLEAASPAPPPTRAREPDTRRGTLPWLAVVLDLFHLASRYFSRYLSRPQTLRRKIKKQIYPPPNYRNISTLPTNRSPLTFMQCKYSPLAS